MRVEVPSTIDVTGTDDVTADLVDFLNAQPVGTDVVFPPGAYYRCENVLLLEERNDFRIIGNRSTIFATTDGSAETPSPGMQNRWPRTRSHVKFVRGGNIHVDNLFVVGAHPTAGVNGYVAEFEGQMGFELLGVVGAKLTDCRASRVYGDFIYLSWAELNGQPSQDVEIEGFVGRGNGRQGVAIVTAHGVQIRRSYFDDVARTHIDIEPNHRTAVVRDIIIRDSTFGAQRLNWISGRGNGQADVGNIEVVGNCLLHASSRVDIGSTVRRRGPVLFAGNVCHKSYGTSQKCAWFFEGVDGINAKDNYISLDDWREMHLIGVKDCTEHGEVKYNVIPGGMSEKIVL